MVNNTKSIFFITNKEKSGFQKLKISKETDNEV